MFRRAERYAEYLAIARIETGGEFPTLQPMPFSAIGQAIYWAEQRIAHDRHVNCVIIYGIDESAGFADQIPLGTVDGQGWCCLVADDPTRPLGL